MLGLASMKDGFLIHIVKHFAGSSFQDVPEGSYLLVSSGPLVSLLLGVRDWLGISPVPIENIQFKPGGCPMILFIFDNLQVAEETLHVACTWMCFAELWMLLDFAIGLQSDGFNIFLGVGWLVVVKLVAILVGSFGRFFVKILCELPVYKVAFDNVLTD